MITLESQHLQFNCLPEHAAWSLLSLSGTAMWIENARMACFYRVGRRQMEALTKIWPDFHIAGPELLPSPHGPIQLVRISVGPDEGGVKYELRFALPENAPLLLCQVSLLNESKDILAVDRIEFARIGPADSTISRPSTIRLHTDPGELAFFANGWQSWSFCGTYGPGDAPRYPPMAVLDAQKVLNPATPRPHFPGHYSSDFFGVLGDRAHRTGLLAGFLGQQQQFGSLEAWTVGEASLRLWANGDGAWLLPGSQMHTDWAVFAFLDLDEEDPLGPYLEAAARQNNVPSGLRPPLGWCSWYQYYQKVTTEDVRANLDALTRLKAKLPLELVQIDDGFESRVGDWFTFSERFPEGVAPLAAEIRAAGFTPGLWLAPFIVHPGARLNKEHPEYILRGWSGRPVNAGFAWNRFTRALDLTHPGALEYACRVVDTAVHEWGYPYLKLDFLYAGALPGKRSDPTRTRAQALRHGLEALRQAAGTETVLLGCGVPLGSALGLFEAVRVSPDVSETWAPGFAALKAPFRHDPTLPSARNAIRTSLARAPLHLRWWVNDPDCMLVRQGTHLTQAERESLATAIALSGGSLIFSDDFSHLSPEELRLAQVMVPPIGVRPRTVDWFDEQAPTRLRLDLNGPAGPWYLLALFNWEDQTEDLSCYLLDFDLPPRPLYLARSFWRGETALVEDGSLVVPSVPAHGVALLAVRPFLPNQAQYVGGNLHISQGLEVAGWQDSSEGLVMRLALPREVEGVIELRLPAAPLRVEEDEGLAQMEALGEGHYRLAVRFERETTIKIKYAGK